MCSFIMCTVKFIFVSRRIFDLPPIKTWIIWFKDALSFALKIMKNAFYFISKALFVLKTFKLLSWSFGHAAKRLDKKDKINFRFCDVTVLLTNNCWYTYCPISGDVKVMWLEKQKMQWKTSPRHFSEKLKLRISLDQ